MMIKKSAIAFACVLLSVFTACGLTPPDAVKDFYNSMLSLSRAIDDSEAYDSRNTMRNCFCGTDSRGINLPNDFLYWGYDKAKILPSNTYANLYEDFSYKKKILRMEKYSIQHTKYISEVDLKQFRSMSSGKTETVVTRTFTGNSITKTFSDTIIVENGKITGFRNALTNVGDIEDIGTLTALAASYYSSEQYYRAYKTYEKIISIDSKNANAYYRLALLTYWRKGCYYDRRTARKKGVEYVEKARRLGSEKAEVAYYYMTHSRI